MDSTFWFLRSLKAKESDSSYSWLERGHGLAQEATKATSAFPEPQRGQLVRLFGEDATKATEVNTSLLARHKSRLVEWWTSQTSSWVSKAMGQSSTDHLRMAQSKLGLLLKKAIGSEALGDATDLGITVLLKNIFEAKDLAWWGSRRATQAAAGYNPLGATAAKGCASCAFFISPNNCAIVEDFPVAISPTGLSQFWMAIPDEAPEPLPVVIINAEQIEKIARKAAEVFSPALKAGEKGAGIRFKSNEGQPITSALPVSQPAAKNSRVGWLSAAIPNRGEFEATSAPSAPIVRSSENWMEDF